MEVKFEGGKAIEAALRSLDVSVASNAGIARRALDKAADPIAAKWKQRVDKKSRDLEESIQIGSRAATKGTRAFKRENMVVERYVGIDAGINERLPVYAWIEEFGDDGQAANPAGRSAFKSEAPRALDDIRKFLWEEIEKTAKRVAKKG